MCEFITELIENGKNEGKIEGKNEGKIEGKIETLREFNVVNPLIVEKLVERFQLTEEQAWAYVNK